MRKRDKHQYSKALIVLSTPSVGYKASDGVSDGVKLYSKSRFSAKVSPTGVVNSHQNPTERFFSHQTMGFRNGSPLFFRNAARFARVKCQVQSENFLSERFFEG